MDAIDKLLNAYEDELDAKDAIIKEQAKIIIQYEQPVPKINVIEGVPNMLITECCGGLNIKGEDSEEIN